MIYRPLRERTPERVLEIAEESLKNTGHEEVAFTSLSAGDYSALLPLLKRFNRKFSHRMLSVSLPSLRVKAVNSDILKEIRAVRKSGFTIAPEAATERLRGFINKDFSEEDYERAVEALFREGWQNLKLYFMIGLPGERDEDIEAIPGMVKRALKTAKRHTSRFVNINVSVSPFVPKAHTPFQWCGQADMEYIMEKKDYLRGALKNINVKGHDEHMSMLEAAFARGDKGLADLIEAAWRSGAKLDGWSESFDFKRWLKAMDSAGVDAFAYAKREFEPDEAFPWEVVDTGIEKEFMRKEYERALSGELTPDCREECITCGLECEPQKPVAELHAGTALRPLRPEPQPRKPIRVRARFSKTGKLRHLSHRELITHVTRAVRRAGVEVEYTKGFNPAPKIAFGPPLGVGIAGTREYLDMEVLPGTPLKAIKDRLNATLTGDVRFDDIAPVGFKEPSLQEFVSRYVYEVGCPDPGIVKEFLDKDEVLVERKKGIVDIRPMVEEARATGPDRVRLVLRDTDEKKVRLDEIMVSVFGRPALEFDITRTGIFGYRGRWAEPLEEGRAWQEAS
jgi:radical SAM-linked protein